MLTDLKDAAGKPLPAPPPATVTTNPTTTTATRVTIIRDRMFHPPDERPECTEATYWVAPTHSSSTEGYGRTRISLVLVL